MSRRAYAQITWSRKRLALGMVNAQGEYFALYAEPLIRLFKKPDEYALVKRMDKNPERAHTYHGGEIWAALTEDRGHWNIQLIYGSLQRRMCTDPEHGVLHYIKTQDFLFPKDELKLFKDCLETMLRQMRDFDRLKMDAETTPGWSVEEL